MEAFISDTGVGGIDHAVDETGDIWSSFGIISQPAWVFIDDDGTTTTVNGALGAEGLEARIQELIDT